MMENMPKPFEKLCFLLCFGFFISNVAFCSPTQQSSAHAYLADSSASGLAQSKRASILKNPTDSIVISGIVVDSLDAPLLGAVVSIRGSRFGAYTNAEGEFVINVPKECAKNDSLVLDVGFLGYHNMNIQLSFSEQNQNLKCVLHAFVIDSPVYMKPSLIRRIWNRIKHPFI